MGLQGLDDLDLGEPVERTPYSDAISSEEVRVDHRPCATDSVSCFRRAPATRIRAL